MAADQARARTLFERVTVLHQGAARAAVSRRSPEEEELGGLLGNLAAERTARLRAGEGDETQVESEIRRLVQELERVRARRRAYARAAGQLIGPPQPISMSEARALLSPGTALLTYVLGADRSHLLVLTPDSLEAFELPPRQVLDEYTETLYLALRDSRSSDRLVAPRGPDCGPCSLTSRVRWRWDPSAGGQR